MFAAGVIAAVMTLSGTAVACVTFKGQMTVDGHDGDTTVVGTGNSHGYCSTGRPTTAAQGHLADSITATVGSAKCGNLSHKLNNGTYEVRYNNTKAYTFDGTYWNMISGTGCFKDDQASTTTTLGTMSVSNGSGTWTGTLGDPAGVDYYPLAGEAANFCVGNGTDGLLAPYRLLAI